MTATLRPELGNASGGNRELLLFVLFRFAADFFLKGKDMETLQKKVSPVTLMAEIAIMAAAGFVLDELSGAMFKGVFVNGGSIGIAMITVILMCYRRGPLAGLAVGFIVGSFGLLTGPYMIASTPLKVFIQVMLDYVLAYPFVALAGIFKPAFDKASTKGERMRYLLFGVMMGTLGKLLCHYLSGILFWADPSMFAWGLTSMNPYLYCLLYNVAYTIPCGILSGIVMALMLQKAPGLYLAGRLPEKKTVVRKYLGKKELIGVAILSAIALGTFIAAFIIYVRSVYEGDYGPDGKEFVMDPDAMMAWVVSALVIVFGIVATVNGIKGRYRERSYPYHLVFVGGVCVTYGLARLIRALIKGNEFMPYVFWIIGGAVYALLIVGSLFLWKYLKQKKEQPEEKTPEEDAFQGRES